MSLALEEAPGGGGEMSAARRVAAAALVAMGLGLGAAPVTAAPASPLPDTLLFTVTATDYPATFDRIGGIASGADGSVFVMDLDRQRVVRFDAAGEVLTAWGARGHRQGQFSFATGSAAYTIALGLATAPDGTVFVADPGNHRVQRFTDSGRFLGAWGRKGTAPGLFDTPIDLAVSAAGVYVQDAGNRRIQRFTLGGAFAGAWPIAQSCGPSTTVPLGIGAAPDGSLYVGVYATDGTRITAGCIQHYSAAGTLQAEWPVQPASGARYPRDVAVATNGDVFVSVGDREIQHHRPDGELVEVLSVQVGGLALAADGTLLGAGSRRIERIAPDGTTLDPITSSTPPRIGTLETPSSVAVDRSGDVYVADAALHRIQRFDQLGVFVGQWGEPGSGPGQLDTPSGVAVAADGTVYVADTGNHRIQWFAPPDTGGSSLPSPRQGAWGGPGNGPGQFDGPTGVAVSDEGDVFVVDAGNHRVQRFSQHGAFLGAFGEPGSGEGALDGPVDVVVDSYGRVYVSDAGNHRVAQYGSSGSYYESVGFFGGGDGQFQAPAGLGLDVWPDRFDREARLLVADRAGHLLQRFDGYERPLMAWGGRGSERGLLMAPTDVAVAPTGRLYVAEATNHRVQVFDTSGSLVGMLGSRALNPGTQTSASQPGEGSFSGADVAAAPDGSMYVASDDNRLLHFSAAGTYLGQWGYAGYRTGAGELRGLAALAAAPDGTLYVLDSTNQRVQSFSPSGTFRQAWDIWPDRPYDTRLEVSDLATAPDGSVYVTSTRVPRLWRFDPSGALLGVWSHWTQSGPQSVAVGPAFDVYTTSTGVTVDRFNASGDRSGEWGRSGSGPGEFGGDCEPPYGGCRAGPVATDGAGLVYVGDANLGRIQRFTHDGRYVDALSPDRALYNGYPITNFDVDRSGPTPRLLTRGGYPFDAVQVFGSAPMPGWRAEYYGNTWLAERPLKIEYRPALDLAWDEAAPILPMADKGLSARFQRFMSLPPGVYEVTLRAEGGARLWVDDALVVDEWEASDVQATIVVPIGPGRHDLQVEYVARGPTGSIAVSWDRKADLAVVHLPWTVRR